MAVNRTTVTKEDVIAEWKRPGGLVSMIAANVRDAALRGRQYYDPGAVHPDLVSLVLQELSNTGLNAKLAHPTITLIEIL